MRRLLVLAAVTATGAVLLAGCGSADEPKTVGASAPPTTAPAEAPPATPGESGKVTLGPFGYGAVKLGMSQTEAKATGLITIRSLGGGACSGFVFKAHPVDANEVGGYISKKYGVASIFAQPGMRTPEGIGLGSTLAQVKRAYPGLEENPNAWTAKATGNPKATYGFQIPTGRPVKSLNVSLPMQDCHN